MNEVRINALACAIAVLEGTAGGYTLKDKQEAKEELRKILQEELIKNVQT